MSSLKSLLTLLPCPPVISASPAHALHSSASDPGSAPVYGHRSGRMRERGTGPAAHNSSLVAGGGGGGDGSWWVSAVAASAQSVSVLSPDHTSRPAASSSGLVSLSHHTAFTLPNPGGGSLVFSLSYLLLRLSLEF